MSRRALIVDDHPIVRNALVTSLVSLDMFDDLDTAGSFGELIDKLEGDANYQLLILDLSLTDVSGADGLVYIRENYSDIPVVVFSVDVGSLLDQSVNNFPVTVDSRSVQDGRPIRILAVGICASVQVLLHGLDIPHAHSRPDVNLRGRIRLGRTRNCWFR